MEEQADQHDAQLGQTDPPSEPQPQTRCETCKKDRKKVCLMSVKPFQTLFNNFQCTRTIGKPRCDWCEDNDYACSMNNELDESMNGKRRKLSKQKCASCRMQKIKVNHVRDFDACQSILMVSQCTPEKRTWDENTKEKCDACLKSDRECGPSEIASRARGSSKQPGQQIERQSSPMTPAFIPSGKKPLNGHISHMGRDVAPQTIPSPRRANTYNFGSPGASIFSHQAWYGEPVQAEIPGMAHPNSRAPLSRMNPNRHEPSARNDSGFYEDGSRSSTIYESAVHDTVIEDPIPRYRYESLDERGIRLINLHPGEGAEQISIDLKPFTEDIPEYSALSYVWGSELLQYPIYVRDRDRTSKLSVQETAYSALRSLRKRDAPILLWIDAICINQEDKIERGAQVRKMSQIYSQAASLVVWLDTGSSGVSSDEAHPFSLITELLNMSQFDKVVQDNSRMKEWQALEKLLQNRWFSRRWVVQEVALARRIIVYWGNRSIYWEDLSDAMWILESRINRLPNLQENANFLDPGDAKRKLPAITLVDICSSLLRKTSRGEIIERKYSLELLVSSLAAFEITDPKDTIYSVLSIAKFEHGLVPSYEKNINDLCYDFVSSCVNESQSLDIICRHWAPLRARKKTRFLERANERANDPLPSWCPSVLGSSFATYDDNSNQRLYGDSFVGLPDKNYYNAALGRTAYTKFEQKKEADKTLQILHVKGLKVATIHNVRQRATKGLIPHEWLEMAGWPPASDEADISTSIEKLWRALVADRDSHGKKAPSWYRRAFLYCLNKPSQEMDIDTQAFLSDPTTTSPVSEFLSRVQSVIWNRKLFTASGLDCGGREGEEEELGFGLAPRQAEKGDIICVLWGCTVPVCLRKKGDYWMLIGEVYLHEMMDGQVFMGRGEEDISRKTELFMLV
jgi:hypothetical protein